MKIVQWNVWAQCFSSVPLKDRVNDIAYELAGADVVCLQELDFMDELRKTMYWPFVAYNKWSEHGHGCAILSRYPLENVVSMERTVTAELNDMTLVSCHLKSKVGNEGVRLKQAKMIVEFLKGRERVIFCGDLNATRDEPAYAHISKHFKDEFSSIPYTTNKIVNGVPVCRVSDYIFTRGIDVFKCSKFEEGMTVYPSDHSKLSIDFY